MGNVITVFLLLLMFKFRILGSDYSIPMSRWSQATLFSLSLVVVSGVTWWTGILCGILGEEIGGVDLSDFLGSIAFYSFILLGPMFLSIRFELGSIGLFLAFALFVQAIFLTSTSEAHWNCTNMSPLELKNVIALGAISVMCCLVVWVKEVLQSKKYC